MSKKTDVSSISQSTFTVLQGEAQKTIAEYYQPNTFDGCLCDPPYGFTAFTKSQTQAWEKRGTPEQGLWEQLFKVLKPGAFLLAASGSRTIDQVMGPIRAAGFRVLDCFLWIYSGANATGTREGYRLRPAYEPFTVARKDAGTYNTLPFLDRSPPVNIACSPETGIKVIGAEVLECGGAWFQCGKAPLSERGKGNDHPTLKPLALTEHLARLILPTKGPRRMIIPFGGVGSEAIGALRAGWEDVTTVELEAKYVKCARARIPTYAPNARAA